MAREIERKFLVHKHLLPAAILHNGTTLSQGYLASKPSVRVRVTEGSAQSKAWLTIKGAGLIGRDEFEYEIPHDDGIALLNLCSSALRKIRYRVLVGRHVWDLDCFLDAHHGLWLAEVELSHEEESFERPAWIADEVSHDGRYTNSALAREGRAP